MSSIHLTLKQKIDVETRKLYSDLPQNSNLYDLNDKNYTELLLTILEISYKNEIDFDNLKFYKKYLLEICNKLKNSKTCSSISGLQIIKNFITSYEKCIKSDINNIKEIMKSNNREFNRLNLQNYATTMGIEIFEAPKNHMKRNWNLRSARIILDKYPELATDLMQKTNGFKKSIFRAVHQSLSNRIFSQTIYNKYKFCYKSICLYKKCSFSLMEYLCKNNIQFHDLDDPDFCLEEFGQSVAETPKKSKADQSISQEKFQRTSGAKEFQADLREFENLEPLRKRRKITRRSEFTNQISSQDNFNTQYSTDSQTLIEKSDASCQTEDRYLMFDELKTDAFSQTEFKILHSEVHAEPTKTSKILSEKLWKLYSERKFADTQILTDVEKKLKVHSCVLACYSEDFIKNFEDNLKIIKIPNTSVAAIEAMLQYMYTDQIDDLDKVAIDLIFLASKYAVKDLLNLCEKHLLKNITIENASEIVLTAYKCNCEQLKEDSKRFVALHIKEVLPTDGFKKLSSVEPNLAIELLCYKINSS